MTQHGCLPNLLGDGDKGIEIVNGEEKILFTGPTRAAKDKQKFLVPARQAQTSQPKMDPFHLSSLLGIHLRLVCTRVQRVDVL